MAMIESERRFPAGPWHEFRLEALRLLGFCALFLAIMAGSAWGTLFKGDPAPLLGGPDHSSKNAPGTFLLDRSIAQSDFPLWNPLIMGGEPYAAHPTARVFYPPNLIRSALIQAEVPSDTIRSLVGLDIFHVFIAALGMYALSRRLGFRLATCYFVSMALAFSPMYWGLALRWSPVFGTTAWTPLVLFCLQLAMTRDNVHRSFIWLFAAGSLYGFQILAGFPQAAVVATFGYIVYAGATLFTGRNGTRSFNKPIIWTFLYWPTSMLFFGLVGVIVAMPYLVLAVEFLGLTARSSVEFEKYTGAMTYSAESLFLISMFGVEDTLSARAIAIGSLLSGYWVRLNVGVLMLAICAVWMLRKRATWPCFCLALVYLDLSVGPPFPLSELLRSGLFFEITHHHYVAGLLSIPLTILAGFGLEAVSARARKSHRPWRSLAYVLVSGCLLIFLMPEPAGSGSRAAPVWSLLPLSLLVALCILVYYGRFRLLVIALLLFEIALCSRYLLETQNDRSSRWNRLNGDWSWLDRKPPSLSLSPFRSLLPASQKLYGNRNMWRMAYQVNGYEPLVLESTQRAFANPGEEFVYNRNIDVDKNLYITNYMKRMFWLAPAWVEGAYPPKDRLFAPTEVAFLEPGSNVSVTKKSVGELDVSAIATPGTELSLWTGDEAGSVSLKDDRNAYKLGRIDFPSGHKAISMAYRSTGPLNIQLEVRGRHRSEIYGVGPVRTDPAGDGVGTLELPMPDFPGGVITLWAEGEELDSFELVEVTLVTDAEDKGGQIAVGHLSPDRAQLRVVDLKRPYILTFADTFYPGWEVSVDGEPRELLKVNGHLKGVEVSAGSHEVLFEFRPKRLSYGLALSMGGLAIILAGFLVSGRIQSRQGQR